MSENKYGANGIRVNQDDLSVEAYFESQWHTVGRGNVPLAQFEFIKSKYRDVTDVENGALNFVSPLYKYLGWYVPGRWHGSTKVDDTGTSKYYYAPSVFRVAGDENVSLENVTAEQWSLTSETTLRKQVYTTEANVVHDVDKLLNPGFTWKHKLSGKTIEVKPKNVGAFYNVKFLPNSLFTTNNTEPSYRTDIVGIIIDWRMLPEGSYIKYYVQDHRNTADRYRLVQIDTNEMPKGDNPLAYLAQHARDLVNDGSGAWLPTTKIERPASGVNYSMIVLEGKMDRVVTGEHDSVMGLAFNVYVPEEYYFEMTRGLGTNFHLFIPDISKVGKLYNAVTSLAEYRFMPCYPKQGDIIKMVRNLSVKGADGNPEVSEFITMLGFRSAPEGTVFDAKTFHHPNTLYFRLPATTVREDALNEAFLLNGARGHGKVSHFLQLTQTPFA